MTTLEALLRAIVADPQNEDRWLVLADWLEEHDDPCRATLLRLHRRLLATCCEPERHPERAKWQANIVALLAEGVRPCVPQRTVKLAKGVKMMFSFIPPGSFLMGSPLEEEGHDREPLHRVTLTKGCWMGAYPVTQAQWTAHRSSNPSKFSGANHPVEHVTWLDCQGFCREVGESVGQLVRLPTEAEWEYACRAGTTTPFFFGETISTDQANYDGMFTYGMGKRGVRRNKTTVVTHFPPNAWGLFDMHGNVWEWCQDWSEAYAEGEVAYAEGEATDPHGPTVGTARVLRSGTFYHAPDHLRSAYRRRQSPAHSGGGMGFRVCMDVTPPALHGRS